MKLFVLSGAYKNAGDFLIVDRSIQLLKYVYPDCEIQTYERKLSLEKCLDDVNKSDAVVFAGGPAYCPWVYPLDIPLVPDLNRIKVPMYTLGLGWFGARSTNDIIYQRYTFSSDAKKLLSRLERDGTLTCRDWYSVRALKNNGFSNIKMTGCPAWYDLENIQHVKLRSGIQFPFKKICISDFADFKNVSQSLDVVKYIRTKYPDAQLVYIFHRGIGKDALTDAHSAQQYEKLAQQLSEMNIEIRDISYSSAGFAVYDDCDLHIGMRVHAHIYNLSKRNISILIEEDGRGAGVNEALGLPSIKAYVPYEANQPLLRIVRSAHNRIVKNANRNRYLVKQIDDYLFMLESCDYRILESAFECQRNHFQIMVDHIRGFCGN